MTVHEIGWFTAGFYGGDRLPHDPYTGDLFWYRPEGFDIEPTFDNAWLPWGRQRDDPNRRIHAHTPIFWSAGRSVLLRPSDEPGIDLRGPKPKATSEPSEKESEVLEQRRKKVLYLHSQGAYVFRLPKPADSE